MKMESMQINRGLIEDVNKTFYEKVYDDPWLALYFQVVEKERIIQQQTDFMTGALGGENRFAGRKPSKAHPHMYITDQLYDLRKSLLIEALEEVAAPQKLVDAWLKIDEVFRKTIVKKSLSECAGRYRIDPILNFSKPISYYSAG
ncbi:hypothetical protein MNBD_NITROSPIRAE01-1443 [hydrothermal vent metagenome]|uniref:Group 1 truncated hemoglobin n=1 Tax=hydrothermal vent metagenome TaxID=652676 RepID=A0A3B1CN00_9ZZZZ